MERKKNSVKNVILLILACLFCSLVTVSCSKDGVASISVSGKSEILVGDFDYGDYTVQITYESGKVETTPLEKSMLSDEDNLKFYSVGEQTLTVNYKGKTSDFNLKVCLYEFENLRFDDVNAVYSGEYVTAEVFKNYPEGTVVYYVGGNSFVNAGTYDVTAIVSRRNYVTQKLTATVTIEPAKYDMSAVDFKDCEFDYDGKFHTVEITGTLPDGVSVVYSGNNQKDVGEYEVTAEFGSDSKNYYLSEADKSKTAKMTIRKKKINYNAKDIVFEDSTVSYDGKKHSLKAENVPTGVKVVYGVKKKVYDASDVEGTEFSDAGEYIYTAEFRPEDEKNCEVDIPSMTATLVIEQAEYDTSKVTLKSEEFDYDGYYHKIEKFYYEGETYDKIDEITQFLPDGMSVYGGEYKKNGDKVYSSVEDDGEGDYMTVSADKVADYGIYIYTLTLYDKNGNYKNTELSATLTINKRDYDVSQLALSEDKIKYTGENVSVEVNGVPKEVCEESGKVIKEGDSVVYREHGKIKYDEDGNVELTDLTYELYYFKIDDIPVRDEEGNYTNCIKDGDDKPATGVTDVGEYRVLVVFTGQDNPNYNYLSPQTLLFSVVEKSDDESSDDAKSSGSDESSDDAKILDGAESPDGAETTNEEENADD